ncbi:MAG: 2'-5' RNA ligase family protein [Proteobacteria bacterium]|nr:2'-5' RNA ligase family protein [Pseudomonadota bacterium]
MAKPESALVVLVPAADPLVGPVRDFFDPSASLGVPAHVTLLYPFVEPAKIDAKTVETLAACFRGFAPFDFALTKLHKLPPETLCLDPEPAAVFRDLTKAIWKLFPDHPPYCGKWPEIVPHLTLGQFASEEELAAHAETLATEYAASLPLRARAADVALLENTDGRWKTRQLFRLGG